MAALRIETLEDRTLLSTLVVNQTPRLQLGDASLAGFTGSETDQVEILWQTRTVGVETQDSFVAEFRPAAATAWTTVATIGALETGIEARTVHSVVIDGLNYDADYEYRIQHLRDGNLIATFQETFHTRLPVGSDSDFTFVAYGNSAKSGIRNANFRGVQDRINQTNAAFAVLLGNNAYDHGTHADLDARFDPAQNPEATAWNASHIDYLNIGDHDLATDGGRPSEDNFSVPIPVAGVNAPAQLPPTERAEHNYSFDYGNVHFVSLGISNLGDAAHIDGLLNWVEADLAASNARWKIVFAQPPVAGVPDKPQSPLANYYQQMVPRLRAAGVDLLMAGQSNTFSWTYPLLDQVAGEATFVFDTDKDYAQGAGLVQLVAGVGGRSLRSGSYDQFPFVASGFSRDTTPALEFGFAQIEVTPTRLTVSYIAADDGTVIDQFSITASDVPFGTVGDSVWEDTNADGLQDAAEPTVSGVTVRLFEAGLDGNIGGGDDLLAGTRTSDATGSYRFNTVDPGSYYLEFSNLPAGFELTLPNAGTDAAADSDPDPSTGRTSLFTVTDNQTDLSWDAGLVALPGGAPPVADDQSIATTAGNSVEITLSASDPEGALLTYSILTDPIGGTLSGSAPDLTYTPNDGFTGSDSITFRVNDGSADSNIATVSINVTPAGAATTIDVRIAAGADDAEESAFGRVGLSSSDLELVFDGSNQTVGLRFTGLDIPNGATIIDAWVQFQTDETASTISALTIAGESTDHATEFSAVSRNISLRPRTAAAVSWSPPAWNTIGAAGPDQQTPNLAAIVQEIVARPGWMSGNSIALLVTGTGARVAESFEGDQAAAPLLHVEFAAGNTPPVADDQTVAIDADTPVAITLSASDAEGDPLTYSTVSDPANGTLSGTAPNLTYTPAVGFTGSDSFSFEANDGTSSSNTATVSISVGLGQPPVLNDQTFLLDENSTIGTVVGMLIASDPDAGDAAIYSITGGSGSAVFAVDSTTGQITVSDAGQLDFETTTSFSLTVMVEDGDLLTDSATITVNLTNVNEPPAVTPAAFVVDENSLVGTLVGAIAAVDPDAGDALTYAIAAGNTDGAFAVNSSTGEMTVAGVLDAQTTPQYSLTVTATDTGGLSAAATIVIDVIVVNDPPVINDQIFSLDENSPLGTVVGTVVAVDPNVGDTLTYRIVGGSGVINGGSDGGTVVGSGVFVDSGQGLGMSRSREIDVGDLDGDGDLDAFVANFGGHPNRVWLNDGSGTFTDSGQALGRSKSYSVALGDLDGDGDLDAFVANNTQPNQVWLNDGTGTFHQNGQNLGTAGSHGVALGDIDGDGDLDAFVVNFSVGPDTVWLNDGTGMFTDSGQILGSTRSTDVALADLDDDGDLDAFITNARGGNTVWWNDGSGTFIDSGQSMGSEESREVALGDVDGDGDLDAAIANTDGISAVWLNDGSGTFTHSGQFLDPSTSQDVSLVDLDNDGDLDLFYANRFDQPNTVWLNDGSGTFTDTGQALGAAHTRDAALGDFDGDGDIDAMAANNGVPNAVWFNVNSMVADPSTTIDVTTLFAIDASTGRITVTDASQLDFESITSFELIVEVADGGSLTDSGSLTDMATVIINMGDVNESPVIIGQMFSVDQNSSVGTVVGTVVADDPDANDVLSFSITGGNEAGAFTIDANTGEITVADSSLLDPAANPSFSLTISVSDNGTLSGTATIIVSVNALIGG